MDDQKKKRISKNTTRNLIASLDTDTGDDHTKTIQPEAEQVSEYNINNDNGQYQSIAANKKRVSVCLFKQVLYYSYTLFIHYYSLGVKSLYSNVIHRLLLLPVAPIEECHHPRHRHYQVF
jgi:hypothetical protein